MTEKEIEKAVETLTIATEQVKYYKKLLLDNNITIDYSHDGTIINVRRPVVKTYYEKKTEGTKQEELIKT